MVGQLCPEVLEILDNLMVSLSSFESVALSQITLTVHVSCK